VFKAKPEIFSHNVECVERISKQVRAQAVWSRSLNVLKESVDFGLRTKTGIMLGLGESKKEVLKTMHQVVDLGVEIFTIGQYLQPTKNHLPVSRYVNDAEFKFYKKEGLNMGFTVVESGALVRSSYHADEQARLAKVV
jgi:lipoic acid synthetase